MLPHQFMYLSALFSMAGIFSYARATLRGTAQPNRVTWFIWTLAPLIATVAQWAQGLFWASLPVFMTGLGPAIILGCSYVNKDAYWKSTRHDYLCGALALIGLVLWAVTREPNIAILFSILSDLFAGLPTLRKAITHPDSEDGIAFLYSGTGTLIGFLALPTYSFASCSFLIYMLCMNSSICIAVYRRKIVALFK